MRKGKHHGYAKYGYIFSIPFMVAFILFSLYPIVYTALIGFTDLKGLGMTNFHFLTEDPFRNFKIILTNPSFQQALRNTVFLWICNFIPQILLALLLTAWFTDKRSKVKGQGLFNKKRLFDLEGDDNLTEREIKQLAREQELIREAQIRKESQEKIDWILNNDNQIKYYKSLKYTRGYVNPT